MRLSQYLLNLFVAPQKNIKGDSYLPSWQNLLFLIIFTIVAMVIALTIRLTLFPVAPDQYHQNAGPLLEAISFVMLGIYFVLLSPLMFLNMKVIQWITKRYTDKTPSFQKMFSNHTTLYFYMFILSLVGVVWNIHNMILNAPTQIPMVFFGMGILIYAVGSGYILNNYLKENPKTSLTIIYPLALIAIIGGIVLLSIKAFESF